MKVAELVTSVRDAITVSRVLTEPDETYGVTVVAAATVAGGGGGRGGHDDRGQEGEARIEKARATAARNRPERP